VTSTACDGQDTATTSTVGDATCSESPADLAQDSADAASDVTVVSGTTIPLEFWPTDPAGWDGSTLTITEFGLPDTATVVVTATTTAVDVTTVIVVVPPTATADCASW
jgi:hypothetical protein